MLLQFICSNFASIRDEVILSLEPASADREHPENIVKKGEYSALNEIAIYGANASGKSNLFRAMTYALMIIRDSSNRQVNDPIPVIPFKFDDSSPTKPTKFEFTFVAKDGRKYIYGFSADRVKVHEEYLYFSTSSGESMIFDRTGENYEFSGDLSGDLRAHLELVQRMNTQNKLFLATATSWNVKTTLIPYKWLSEELETFNSVAISDMRMPGSILRMYRDNQKYAEFTIDLLQNADINIDSVSINSLNISDSDINLDELGDTAMLPMTKILTQHRLNGSDKKYSLTLAEESLGTRMLFGYSPLIKMALDSGKTLFIDEIERSMHPSLVKFLLNMFRSTENNPNGAQLIFITHETTLLARSIFRLDQIYFTEKNSNTAVTTLYSLDEFKVSKSENIEEGYLLGRFGAIPFLQTEVF